ncbi:MAG TPA: ABC transporter substrate-binding protein [Candidatus Dormibacteraeota bacterium]|nr:ABC transporter substrate-binding protein [Candidatus Dormibacteraeota bacterium]
MERGRWLPAAMVALATLVVAACGGSASSSSSGGATAPGVTSTAIQIGTTNAETGVVSASASLTQAGAQAVFAQVNASGGIYGRKIQQTVLDDAYTAPKAVANVRTFMSKPVFAVFGGYGTVPSEAIVPILQQAKIPYLFPYQGNPYPNDKYLFLVMPVYRDQTVAVIENALKRYGKGTVYALVGKTADTAQTVQEAIQATQKAGGTWLGYDQVNQGTTDYTPYVLRMKQMHPDYLFVSTDPTDCARYVTAVVAQGALPSKHILGLQTMADETFINAVPEAADDMLYAPGPNLPASSPQAKQCTQIIDKYAPGTKITMETLWGCGTAQLLVYALRKAGPNLTREGLVKVLQAMHNANAASVFTPISYSPTNNVGERTMYEFTSKGKELISIGTMPVPNSTAA